MKVLVKGYPGALTPIANLASVYHNQEQWKEAEEFGKQVIEVRKRVLSDKHPDTLASMAKLACAFNLQ